MTGKDLFNNAIDICALKSSLTDAPNDITDLSDRALSLINIILAENSSLDCKIRKVEHEVLKIDSINDTIPCSDILASAVLPYGLARLLMLGEDDVLVGEIERLYAEAKLIALRFGRAKHGSITEVYL